MKAIDFIRNIKFYSSAEKPTVIEQKQEPAPEPENKVEEVKAEAETVDPKVKVKELFDSLSEDEKSAFIEMMKEMIKPEPEKVEEVKAEAKPEDEDKKELVKEMLAMKKRIDLLEGKRYDGAESVSYTTPKLASKPKTLYDAIVGDHKKN